MIRIDASDLSNRVNAQTGGEILKSHHAFLPVRAGVATEVESGVTWIVDNVADVVSTQILHQLTAFQPWNRAVVDHAVKIDNRPRGQVAEGPTVERRDPILRLGVLHDPLGCFSPHMRIASVLYDLAAEEIPELKEIHAEHSDIKLLYINVQESKEKVASFAQKNSIEYTVLLDTAGIAAGLYNVRGIPHQTLISKEGKILYEGPRPREGLVFLIKKTLGI